MRHATLEAFIEQDNNSITYKNTIEPILKKGKVTNHLLEKWPLEERIQKFFEFCRAYDVREEPLLKSNPQQFSHRLHWTFSFALSGIQRAFIPMISSRLCVLKLISSCSVSIKASLHKL